MSTDMDVDADTQQSVEILVHPLAIVNMSDHYTRITCGGSPLAENAPVVGLLFGHLNTILDSNDIPPLQQQHPGVDLHQAVFSKHQVVGWYRVVASGNATITPDDVRWTRELQRAHQGAALFVLLQAPEQASDKKPPADGKVSGEEKKDEEDETLPMSLYSLSPDQQALVAVEEWSLQSFTAERIAMEHVIRSSNIATSSNESPFLDETKQWRESWQVMSQKWQVIQNYLQQVQDGTLPNDNPALLRSIHQLVLSCPTTVVMENTARNQSIQQLAALAKTVDAVHSYVGKFRVVRTEPLPSRRPRGRPTPSSSHHMLNSTFAPHMA